jgi:hypothetical protein
LCNFTSPLFHPKTAETEPKKTMASNTENKGHDETHGSDADSSVPIVSFLGPSSSYSHQVYTLYEHEKLAWAFGLTDFDIAQAALSAFEGETYDYKPATMIQGNTIFENSPILSLSRPESNRG